jgi:hypothetical protein
MEPGDRFFAIHGLVTAANIEIGAGEKNSLVIFAKGT